MALEDSLKDDIDFLLSLRDNFDGEGAMPPKKKTIDRAINYAKHMTAIVKSQLGIELITPHLWLGPDASADAFWRNYDAQRAPNKNGEYTILLNVPPRNAVPEYYAEFFTDKLHKYEGKLPKNAKELIER